MLILMGVVLTAAMVIIILPRGKTFFLKSSFGRYPSLLHLAYTAYVYAHYIFIGIYTFQVQRCK